MNIGVNNFSQKNQDEREENAKSSQRTENSLARTKLYVGEEYLDWWPGAEGRKPPIPVLLWLTDGQKSFLKRRRKKKNLFKYSWLNQHSSTLIESEAAAVWDVIQEFIQLSASQHPYNVDSAGCRFIFPTSRERALLSLWSLPPI